MATVSLLSSVDNSNMASNSNFMQQQQQLQHQKIVSKLNDINKRNKLTTASAATTNALHQTVLDGRIKQFSYFLKMGSKVNSRDIYGRTCLMLACLSDHEEYGLQVAKILLKNGADINIQDRLGRTSLFMACDAKREKLFNYFLDEHLSSVDLRIRDNDGNILLNHVAVHGSTKMLKKLIEKMLAKHIDVDVRNKKGNTALLLAIQNEKYLNAYIILTYGQASPYLKDNDRFLNALEWLLLKFNLNKDMILKNQVKNSGYEETITTFETRKSVEIGKQPTVCSQLFEQTDNSLSLPKFQISDRRVNSLPVTLGSVPHLPSIQKKNNPNYKTWYSSLNNQYFNDSNQCDHVTHPNYSTEHHKSTYIPLILTPRQQTSSSTSQLASQGSLGNQEPFRMTNHSESTSSLVDTPSDYFYKSGTLQNSSQLNEIDETSTQKEIIQKLYETIYIKMFEMSVQNTQASWSPANQNANTAAKAEPEAEKPAATNTKSKKNQSNKSSSKPVSSTPVAKPANESSKAASSSSSQPQQPASSSSPANAFSSTSAIKPDQDQSESLKAKLASLNLFNLEAMRQTPKLLALIPESKITVKQGIHSIYELYDANLILAKSTSRTTNSSMTNENANEQRNAKTQRSKSILPSAKRSIQTASKASNKHSASTRVKFSVDD